MSGIRGFREVVGSDGEVTYEFASSSGESDSEEDLDYIPPASALARRNAIPNLNTATDWNEGEPNVVNLANSSDSESSLDSSAGSGTLDAIIGEDSVEDVNDGEVAGPSFAADPMLFADLPFRTLAEDGINSDEEEPDEPIPGRSMAARTRSRRGRRPKRRKRVVAKKRKPAPKKPRAPPKPPKELPPITIRDNKGINGDIQEYKNIMKTRITKIRFSKSAEDVKGYRIGGIEFVLEEGLSLNQDPPEEVPSFNMENASEVIPGLVSIEFSVSNDNNVVLIKRERPASSEEATSITQKPPWDKKKGREFICFIVEHYYFSMQVGGDLPVELFEGLRQKTLRLDLWDYSPETKTLRLNIILLETGIIGVYDLTLVPVALTGVRKNLLCYLFGVENVQKIEPQEKEDIEWFYGQVQKYHQKEFLPDTDFPLQHPSVKPSLRDYQKAAVRWMLYKEDAIGNSEAKKKNSEIIGSFLEKTAVPVMIEDEGVEMQVYYNPYLGCVSWERPQIPPFPSGGILADEMGLGKTVEVLALILLNPCPELTVRKGNVAKKEEVDTDTEKSSEEQSDASSSSSDCPVPRKKKKSKRKRKRRSPSPCEYVAHNFDEEEKDRIIPSPRKRKSNVIESSDEAESQEESKASGEGSSPRKRKPRKFISSDEEESQDGAGSSSKGSRTKARRRSSNDSKCGGEKTYDRIKVLYDAALSGFSAANVQRPRFHGTFFDTTIRAKARFECLCGEGRADRRKVVSCTHCLSSQHVECVNFDRTRGEANYLCPHCEVSGAPIDVKSTLIVTPPTISHQWINEIQRHIKNKHMNILFYKGVAKHGYFPPYRFAEYDLVITTYSVLSADLNYVDLPHTNSEDGRKFRNAKRFLTTPSSLPVVRWWRVCLDEAQMVEGMATKMAAMASRLQGVHRWCVTGTPLNKGLEDLHGLFAFLGVSPISQDLWWEFLVRVPFYKKDTSLLFELFGQTIWRTGKQSVLNQLGIPPQTNIFHWLQFSPVEAHFYKRQYETCAAKITAKIARLRQLNGAEILQCRLSALDRQTLHSLLQPFLELRQACCHPQMVRGNVINLQKLKGTMTMEDLLMQLIKKTKLQCMDDHRLIVAALNGLAGLYLLSSRAVEAADCYREVLQRAEKHKEQFQTDSLQLLHALENLADVLDKSYAGVGYTLNDDKLRPRAAEIRSKYLQKYAESVRAAKDVVYPVTNTVIDLMENFNSLNESWWVKAIRRAVAVGKDEDLIGRIKDDLTYKAKLYKKKSTNSIAHQFNDFHGLQYCLIKNIQELEETRDDVLGGLDDLIARDPSSFVEQAVYCHLRGQTNEYYNENSTGFRCELCRNHDKFLEYEALLFSAIENMKISRVGRNRQVFNFAGSSGQELTSEERAMILMREQEELVETTEHVNVNMLTDQRRQTWADSDTEKIIKALLNFAKLNGCSVPVIEDGMNHVKIFEHMKKEFRLLRVLWRQVFDQVSAIDELGQATTRLRVREENEVEENNIESKRKKATIKALSSGITEKADKIMNIHVLQRHEIDLKIEQIKADYETGKDSLSVHLGQLFYLETLNKNGYGKKGAFNADDCPICANPLGHQWCVLICGHSFCSDCIKELGSRNSVQSFQCPLCRAHMKMSTVSFIDTRVEEEPVAGPSTSAVLPPTKAVEVKGSHSTKVEKIVETLLRLQESHPGEKVLVFSTWTDVLEIIGHALEQNDIQYCLLMATAKSKFHETIERFKNREDIQALLIPIQSGSKGLNLIEATHVLLVEPIVNLASEAQAIGRVHRIGQTKPTYVHRFYVRNTIEEHLYEILKSHDVSSDEEGLLTVADLQRLVTQRTSNLTPRPNPSVAEVVSVE